MVSDTVDIMRAMGQSPVRVKVNYGNIFPICFFFFPKRFFYLIVPIKWPEEWNTKLRNVAEIGSGSLFHCVCVYYCEYYIPDP